MRATPGATTAINLIRPSPSGELPMRRIFEDEQGNEVGQLDLWKYGYDARKRSWYRETMKADRSRVSSPYLAFSIGAPVITVSAPLRGKVPGVLAADLKLDTFSEFVQAQRPGEHGIALIFDSSGSLVAHPDFAQFVSIMMTSIPTAIAKHQRDRSGLWRQSCEGRRGATTSTENPRRSRTDYLQGAAKFTLGERVPRQHIADGGQEDFAQDVRGSSSPD